MAEKSSSLKNTLLKQLDPLTNALRVARGGDAQKTRGASQKPVRSKAIGPASGKSKSTSKKTGGRSPKKTTTPKISPLAPEAFPNMPVVAGVRLGTGRTGDKYKGRDDLLAVLLDKGTACAGVTTTSKMPSAPVDWCRSLIETDHGMDNARMLVVNAGNANAFTGQAGKDTVRATAAAAAGLASCRQKDVLIASTGVIGEVLNPGPLVRALEKAHGRAKPDNWAKAAAAIMTTDTYSKGAHASADIDGATVNICGIAKGSGMIQPDMATMLSFVFTDAAIPAPILQTLLSVNVRHTFNAISVDSDTSTSDTVLVFATGKGPAHTPIVRAGDRRLMDFRSKLLAVMTDLAHQVVRDGEGATKFISIKITGAASARSAKTIASAVANSPLVKTALAGEDANWGRIVMAVGKAGEPADRDRLSIRIGGYGVAKLGQADPDYAESRVAKHLKGQEIEIEIDVGVGAGEAVVWTCDLTHQYISINADYRS